MSTLVERLRAEAERLSGSSIRNGCPDCGIAANVAEEAADALSARLTLPAEVVRYEPMVQPFRGEDVVTMAVVNFGQWVRYEDHAVALAASEAARREAEERLTDSQRSVAEMTDLLASTDQALDQSKTGGGAA